nr:hypothetical protein GCM10020241_58250 [Streptoalloteichus tenebrarius]
MIACGDQTIRGIRTPSHGWERAPESLGRPPVADPRRAGAQVVSGGRCRPRQRSPLSGRIEECGIRSTRLGKLVAACARRTCPRSPLSFHQPDEHAAARSAPDGVGRSAGRRAAGARIAATALDVARSPGIRPKPSTTDSPAQPAILSGATSSWPPKALLHIGFGDRVERENPCTREGEDMSALTIVETPVETMTAVEDPFALDVQIITDVPAGHPLAACKGGTDDGCDPTCASACVSGGV